MRRLVYLRNAEKALSRLPLDVRVDLVRKLRLFAEDGVGDVKRLAGRPFHRLRSGDYRVILRLQGDVVEVRAAAHGSIVYR